MTPKKQQRRTNSNIGDRKMNITDEEMQRLPWTRDLMTNDELQRWVASRKVAGLAIDIETCELGSWKANDFDPYGANPNLDEEIMDQIGTNRFVRSPESCGWVCQDDLPVKKVEALYARHERESEKFRLDKLVASSDSAADGTTFDICEW